MMDDGHWGAAGRVVGGVYTRLFKNWSLGAKVDRKAPNCLCIDKSKLLPVVVVVAKYVS